MWTKVRVPVLSLHHKAVMFPLTSCAAATAMKEHVQLACWSKKEKRHREPTWTQPRAWSQVQPRLVYVIQMEAHRQLNK